MNDDHGLRAECGERLATLEAEHRAHNGRLEVLEKRVFSDGDGLKTQIMTLRHDVEDLQETKEKAEMEKLATRKAMLALYGTMFAAILANLTAIAIAILK